MPEIELRGNTLDSIWILALMNFPTDEELRRKYYAVRYAESMLEETVPTDVIEMEADLVREILESPAISNLLEIVGKQTRDAFIVSNYLATLYVMYSFPSHFGEPSVRKAIFVVQNLAEQMQYGDGSSIPHSETKIRRCIENFRSVAHLWAALTLHNSFPIREQEEILVSPEAVRDLLGIAGSLQDFGCDFAAERPRDKDKKPLLDLETIWRVPESINRLTLPWTAPPRWIIETLDRYKA